MHQRPKSDRGEKNDNAGSYADDTNIMHPPEKQIVETRESEKDNPHTKKERQSTLPMVAIKNYKIGNADAKANAVAVN
jgi:hypothetical protein